MKIKMTEVAHAINWLASKGHCPTLVFDDNGMWALCSDGVQSIRMKKTDALSSTVYVEAKEFRSTICAAVSHYMDDPAWKKEELAELRAHLDKQPGAIGI